MAIKMATCCYCGTKSTLRLDADHHELICGQCGAPLRRMKQVPLRPADPVRAAEPARKAKKPKKQKKPKKRKSIYQRVLAEIVDEIFD